jgi:uncharacterized protein (TIGR02246 family)
MTNSTTKIGNGVVAVLAAASVSLGCASSGTEPSASRTEAPTTSFDASTEVEPATALLRRYETALNQSDVATIVSLYSPDGIFMAQHRSPAIGAAQVEQAYREILGAIRLNIRFDIDEVVVASPTVAYARTRSSGTTTILANNAQVSEGNQELFVLVRGESGGEWKIGRYIFSTTQPRG